MKHKDYVLPEADLSHDEGDPRWHAEGQTTPIFREDGTVLGYHWNGLEPGHYHEYWRLCVEEQWAQQVAAFEEDPDDVHAAYWYVDGHPAFWSFGRQRNNDYPVNHVSRLEHEGALMYRSWPMIAPHRDEEGLIWWYEFGKQDLFPNEHGFHASWHDSDLDGHAASYEAAVIEIAMKIWQHYGNDRKIVDGKKWEKGGSDGGNGSQETQEAQ